MAAAQAPSRCDPLGRRVRSALSNPGVLFSLIWQIFLVYPVMAVLSADAPAGLTVLGLVAVVAFSVAYVVAFASPAASDDFALDLRDRRPGGRPVSLGLGHLAVLVLCAFGTAPAAGANSVVAFLPFLACFLTAAWPLRWSVPACAGLVAAGVGAALVVDEPALLVPAFLVVPIALSMIGTRAVVGVSEREARLRRALGAADERDRVGRDLHDVLGHTLTALTIRAQLADALVDTDPEAAHRELATIEDLTRTALSEMRQTVSGLRSVDPAQELAGFRESLRSAGIEVEIVGGPDAVPARYADLAAWTLREAGTNIVRHSGATRATVELTPAAVRVVDDGVGPAAAPGDGSGNAGQGLAGLQRRARDAGATFAVTDARDAADGSTGPGTAVEMRWS